MFDQVSTVRSLASAQLTQLNLKFSDWMFFTETVGSPSRHLSLCFHEYRRAPLTSSQGTRRFQSQLFIFYSDEALELPPTVVCAENDQDFLLFSNACYSHCLHPLGKCIKAADFNAPAVGWKQGSLPRLRRSRSCNARHLMCPPLLADCVH